MSTTTATTVAHSPAPASPASRVWRVVRLLTTNPWTTVGWPLIILGAIFAMTWTIWWLIFLNIDPQDTADAAEGIQYNGAMSYIFVYMLVVAVQAVNLTFPLALGYGSTRRAFTLGAGLAFVILSAAYAVVMTAGAWLERLTDGWGVHGSFFLTFFFATDAGWLAQWWIYFCWFVFFFFVGMAFAALYVRWKAAGLIVGFGVLALLVLGGVAALTLTDSWMSFWDTLGAWGTLGVATSLLVPGVVTAAIGHLVLRRATPRG
jgi:hypothetical protein